jgi:hypothetical protein
MPVPCPNGNYCEGLGNTPDTMSNL